MTNRQTPNRVLDHLFRHYWGRAVAGLARQFGIQFLGNIEDAVQESLLAATKNWPIRGIPQNPEGWLYAVARNRLIDEFRRIQIAQNQSATVDYGSELFMRREIDDPQFRSEIADDVLRMMVLCCDPGINLASRCALTLQIVCGFSPREIASAYLCSPDTVVKRISRARKRIFRGQSGQLLPDNGLLDSRIDSVLEVVYLLFNEGYSAFDHEQLVRFELCAEALRLSRVLVSSRCSAQPVCRALVALVCLQSARLPSRQGKLGELILLENQDRSLWDRQLIAEGMDNLQKSATGETLSRYHLEAGIAACHISARSYSETDWPQIVYYYDRLVEIRPSLIVLLNRLVAVSMVEGPRFALTELKKNPSFGSISKHYLFKAVVASCYHRLGDLSSAANHYQLAFETATNPKVRAFLQARVFECRQSPMRDSSARSREQSVHWTDLD